MPIEIERGNLLGAAMHSRLGITPGAMAGVDRLVARALGVDVDGANNVESSLPTYFNKSDKEKRLRSPLEADIDRG